MKLNLVWFHVDNIVTKITLPQPSSQHHSHVNRSYRTEVYVFTAKHYQQYTATTTLLNSDIYVPKG